MNAMFDEMTKQKERATHNNRHHLNEIELMCNVLMEDSEWLDSYQTTVLENNIEKTDRVTILDDLKEDNTLTSEQQQLEVHREDSKNLNRTSDEENCRESKRICCTQPLSSFSELNDLPAPEFVFGSKSVVASESVRLLRRAANETCFRKTTVNHTILFKKPSIRDEH